VKTSSGELQAVELSDQHTNKSALVASIPIMAMMRSNVAGKVANGGAAACASQWTLCSCGPSSGSLPKRSPMTS